MEYDEIISDIFGKSVDNFISRFEIERIFNLYKKMNKNEFCELCEYFFLKYKNETTNIYRFFETFYNLYEDFEILEYFIDKKIYTQSEKFLSVYSNNCTEIYVYNITVQLFDNGKKEMVNSFLEYVKNDTNLNFTKLINRILVDDRKEIIDFILDDNDFKFIDSDKIIKNDCLSLSHILLYNDLDDLKIIISNYTYPPVKCFSYIIDHFDIDEKFVNEKIISRIFTPNIYNKFIKKLDIKKLNCLVKIVERVEDHSDLFGKYDLCYEDFIKKCLFTFNIKISPRLIHSKFNINMENYKNLNFKEILDNRKNEWTGYWFNKIKNEFHKEEIIYFYDELMEYENMKDVYILIKKRLEI